MAYDTLTSVRESIASLVANVEKARDEALSSGSIETALTFYQSMKEGYEAIDEQRKRLYHLKDDLDKNRIPDLLEGQKIDKVRVPSLALSFYILPKLSVSIPADKKPAAYDWLKNNGGADLPQLTVNAGTLSSFIGSLVKEKNIEPPTELFVLNSYRTVGSSKYTPKK